ncbi:transcriptional repressor [bacterium]|nr:transcriptional repressor [bacterium]NCQ55151.1 transcriptional repressor [Candidatus Parcubacteria bacterium]NCS67336.1 transcriptional repressor [Candidatus Peregrinibacteria bacterium]NCS96591.1 transcriptional repressor [bacterium]
MRQTPLYKSVLKHLKAKAIPISVPDLTLALEAQSIQPNKTTLYRLLERLENEGLVETVLLDNKTAFYEIKKNHHHHFVCEDCSTIECLEDNALEQKIHALEHDLSSQGLKIKTHQFSFTGLCAACQ